jgi:hypothetical protein
MASIGGLPASRNIRPYRTLSNAARKCADGGQDAVLGLLIAPSRLEWLSRQSGACIYRIQREAWGSEYAVSWPRGGRVEARTIVDRCPAGLALYAGKGEGCLWELPRWRRRARPSTAE